MQTKTRRDQIIAALQESETPISATTLASQFNVSRQVIVGDIAILRASGNNIASTPRGYLYHSDNNDKMPFEYVGVIACKHTFSQLIEELYTVVDYGGSLIDVTIEHAIYGQISGALAIHSRYDADLFATKVQSGEGKPLSDLTEGIHLHRIGCKDVSTFLRIENALLKKGIALHK
ncbi:transcription repressor NadR [Sinanaerobacter sp. ZZT-01]|uniref:transcription repressor NadR n=1 Tax=Sinanaerobacter sp. ZZT-01 TaxID=3111540 RepID=UPI002D7835B5|nr:transcription repressor NadR [Sinanaerobacter sp. ZZT-01]WRR92178.1 transcription repressor NadR [Sinanaerobacter sp. ZZT-01]